MRMRFKPYAHDELMAADFHVHEPLIWGGKWHSQYARPEQPFVLELGCGKGGFISQLASAHPENNYLGIDITDKVLILAKRKIEAAYAEAGRPIDNVKIMSTDIERIKGVITPEDTVSRIYINFCNPWSKNASSNKHRLTYPRQLIQYRDFLKDGGEIYFKTDDDDQFRDSLTYFPASATTSSGRLTTSTRTSRSGTSAPSMRGCSPRWALRSRPSSPARRPATTP